MTWTREETQHGDYPVYRIVNDYYGNPRYIIHPWAIGDDEEAAIQAIRSCGGKKFRGRDFRGWFVFQSYNLDDTLRRIGAAYHDIVGGAA